jgi:NADH-quinone oxidoreductase subunit C
LIQGSPAVAVEPVLAMTRDILDERVPGAVLGVDPTPPEGGLWVDPTLLVAAAEVLRDDERLQFTLPLFVTAVDHLERNPRFDVVYQLRSLHLQAAIRLKVGLADAGDDLPSIPSLALTWPGMNWLEREVFDLFGIDFGGHPDLRRLMMPTDWEGHPLRKDYVSFGEPITFTDRASYPPEGRVTRGAPD